MYKTIPEYDIDVSTIFEDAIDIALASDDSIDDIEVEEDESEDDIVDTDISYEDDDIDNSLEGVDADDIIAAERDIAFNPFEDDEVIDAAIGDDKDINFDVDVDELVDD